MPNVNNFIAGCKNGDFDQIIPVVDAQERAPDAWSVKTWLRTFKNTGVFAEPRGPLYTFNVVSLSESSGEDYMRSLSEQLESVGEFASFIELGNELYYKKWKLSPAEYLQRISPAVREAWRLWPGVKLALVGNMLAAVQGGGEGTNPRWMKELGLAFQSWPERDLISGITFHDYTCRPSSLVAMRPTFNEDTYASIVAAWPHASIQLGRKITQESFNRDLTQWQTESGIGFFFSRIKPRQTTRAKPLIFF
jgi:hypothetical protein